ncbi:MAG: hypothetical protein HQL19_08315 [Candidatus Omnitrophica bacterium]|nr:hypothetical protein [Candidatus Omnitrophota bacterium]
MKTLLMKIFLVAASALCMFEGLFLIAIGLGRLSPDRLVTLYTKMLTFPKILTSFELGGVFFVLLGFILLVLSSRTRPVPKIIQVEKDGRIVEVPQETVRNFIRQILRENPRMSDFTVEFETKSKDVELVITSSFNGVSSIHEELGRVESVLRSEIENVFAWKGFQVAFHMRGVSVNPEKQYFPGSKPAGKAVAATVNLAAPEAMESKEEALSAAPQAKEELLSDGEGSEMSTAELDAMLKDKGADADADEAVPAKAADAGKKRNPLLKMLLG